MKMRLRTAMSVIAAIAASASVASAQATTTTPDHPAAEPIVKLSAATLGYGNAIYGGAPVKQAIVLSNPGTADLHIISVTMTGNSDFTQTSSCGTTVAAKGQCQFTISFAPHALGARSAVLNVRTNAAGSPLQVHIAGTGCRYFSPAAARFFLTSC